MESCKDSLTTNQDLQSSVDWLTEVIHRFTDAYMKGNGPNTVNMDVLMHAEKVSTLTELRTFLLIRNIIVEEVWVTIYRQSVDPTGNCSVWRWNTYSRARTSRNQGWNWYADHTWSSKILWALEKVSIFLHSDIYSLICFRKRKTQRKE